MPGIARNISKINRILSNLGDTDFNCQAGEACLNSRSAGKKGVDL
jgi:hypothetical protein